MQEAYESKEIVNYPLQLAAIAEALFLLFACFMPNAWFYCTWLTVFMGLLCLYLLRVKKLHAEYPVFTFDKNGFVSVDHLLSTVRNAYRWEDVSSVRIFFDYAHTFTQFKCFCEMKESHRMVLLRFSRRSDLTKKDRDLISDLVEIAEDKVSHSDVNAEVKERAFIY